MDRREFVSVFVVSFSGCLGTGNTDDQNESYPTEDPQSSDYASVSDLRRTGEKPYESTDEEENICSERGRDLAIETGDEVREIRVEVRDDGETFYSVEGVVPADAMFLEQNVVRKRGGHEVRVYVGGDLAETFDWRVDDGHATALVRFEDGEVTTRSGETSGALTLREVNGQDDTPTHDDVPPLNETDLLEHDAVSEAFERAEGCADDPGREGCNHFVEEDAVGVRVTGVEGEELEALYRKLESSPGECDVVAYVEKNGVVYEMGVEKQL